MDKNRWKKISLIIDAALDLPEKSRYRYVQTTCEGDDALLQEVYELLHSLASANDSGILESHLQKNRDLLHGVSQKDASFRHHETKEGSTIGDWKLIQLLGRGGMGSVYKAKRISGNVEQFGALKILHHHLNTPEHISRFHQEQQILAGLHHPNITLLIEGGVSENGLPYLVMEFIEGKPLLEYCDEHRLSVDDRISLFIQICNAVQYAHKKLVVHRDLKPDNILVTTEGNIKILDFGIAKLLDSNLFRLPFNQTREGLRLMSLEYASPEQINGEPISVSTDIYALGMLLSELLTGIHPLENKGKTYREMVHIILNDEIPAPSQVLRQQADPAKLKDIFFKRTSNPPELIKTLQGDLDAITGKSIRKEPEHRYDTVGHFIEDLERYLKTQPVLARRGTVSYRANKFIKRNRSILAVTSVFLLIVSGFGFYHIYQISEQRNLAQQEAEANRAVLGFIESILYGGNPYDTDRSEIPVLVIEDAARRLHIELDGQPQSQVRVLNVLGYVYRQRGETTKSLELLYQARDLGQAHELTDELIYTRSNIANVYNWKGGSYEEAEEMLRAVLADRVTRRGSDAALVAQTQLELTDLLHSRGLYTEAETIANEAIAVGHYPAWANRQLGMILRDQGRYELAETHLLKAIDLDRHTYGMVDSNIASDLEHYGQLLLLMGRPTLAEEALNEARDIRLQMLGSETGLVWANHWLGLAAFARGDLEQAETLLQQMVESYTQAFSADSHLLAFALSDLGWIRLARGEYEQPEEHFRSAIEILEKVHPISHPRLAEPLMGLAFVAIAYERLTLARDLAGAALDIRRTNFASIDENHPMIVSACRLYQAGGGRCPETGTLVNENSPDLKKTAITYRLPLVPYPEIQPGVK